MKKIILSLLMATAAFSFVEAQNAFTGTTTNPNAIISDATVDTIKISLLGNNRILGIHAIASRTSGTMAGTVRLYGTSWDSTGTWHALGDTLTLSNAAMNSKTWTITDNVYSKLYILQSGGTTVKGYLRAKVTALKN